MSNKDEDEKINPFDRKPLKELNSKINNKLKEELADEIDDLHQIEKVDKQNLYAILNDLDVPKQTQGPFDHVTKERWLLVVEHLLLRGVKSGREISRLTNLSVPTACKFMDDVKNSLSKDLTVSKINTTREILFAENEVIADFCWDLIKQDPTDNKVPSLLKIIGDTNTRRSRLYGLENIQLNVSKTETTTYDAQTQQKLIADRLGVSPQAMTEMAKILASKINQPVIDAEFTEITEKEDNDDNDQD